MNVLHKILCAGWLGILAVFTAMAQSNASANATRGNSGGSWLTPSEELNAELPYWLRFHGQERMRAEGADGQRFQSLGDGYLLNRFRFQMDVLPTTWLTFHFQVQDAEAFGKNNLRRHIRIHGISDWRTWRWAIWTSITPRFA